MLTVATLNLWGRWADWTERLGILRATWPDPGPDVVLMQEVRHDEHGDQAEEVAGALGYPERVTVEGHRGDDGAEGLAIISRVALDDVRVDDLPPSDPPRRALRARVALNGTAVTVLCAHTVAVPEDARAGQVAALLAREEDPLVIGADLNEVPDVVAPLLSHAGLDDSLAGDLVPTWPMNRVLFGEAWTARLGTAPHFSLNPRRLDYLLSRGLHVDASGVDHLGTADGRYASDHALLWARYRTA